MKRFVLPFLFALTSAVYAGTPDGCSQQTSQNASQQKPLPSANDEMHEAMVSMCKGMDSMKMTGSIDHDFLLMMIPHHQSALDMTKAYLKEGLSPEIRETAEKIIAAQEQEIAEMQTWLNEHPAGGSHPHQ